MQYIKNKKVTLIMQ